VPGQGGVTEPLDVQVEVSGRDQGINRSRLVLSGTAVIERAQMPEGRVGLGWRGECHEPRWVGTAGRAN
jgi:hypothetical protein